MGYGDDTSNNCLSCRSKQFMKKTLCLFPKDETTEFLRPIYEELCNKDSIIGYDNDAIEDDDYFEKLENLLQQTDNLIFLGHGSSNTLYGTSLNPIIDDKSGNLDYLRKRKLLLFSCKSSDYIKHYNLNDAIGFGFIPTSKDDAHDGAKLHDLDISNLDHASLQIFRDSIVRIWQRTLKQTDWYNTYSFISYFSFFTNIEIVNVLKNHKNNPNYRLVADMLYYLKTDIEYVE